MVLIYFFLVIFIIAVLFFFAALILEAFPNLNIKIEQPISDDNMIPITKEVKTHASFFYEGYTIPFNLNIGYYGKSETDLEDFTFSPKTSINSDELNDC